MTPIRPSRIARTLALTILSGTAATAGITLTPIVMSDQAAPGLPGLTYSRLAQPRFNADGTVAFWARLEGQGTTDANDGSIWSDRSGTISLAFREDGPAPLAGDVRWAAFPFPAFNAAGDLSFTAALINFGDPPAPTSLGIFAEQGADPLVVAREGNIAPGLPNNGKFDGLPVTAFTDAGTVAFNGSKGSAAWNWAGADPQQVVVIGTTAPGLGPPWQFSFIDSPADNGRGVLAFRASLVNPAKPKEPRPSLWSGSEGGPALIAWADPAHVGRYFTDFGIDPVISAAGEIRFWASMGGDGVDPSNDSAILQAAQGSPDQLVGEGNAAPGGGLFGQLPRQLAGNSAGDLAFVAPLTGPGVDTTNNSGIYLRSEAGALSLIAREGDQAPGQPDGVLFAVLGQPALNEAGQIAFTAQLRGAADQGSNFALFMTDVHGAVQRVVRAGDVIDVGGGDNRTVREIAFTSGDPGTGYTQFSPDGALVLYLGFTDKTHGLFEAAMGSPCYADLDGSGTLDLFDFLAFVNLFNAGDTKSDCDVNGSHDLFDFLCFVNAFNAGC